MVEVNPFRLSGLNIYDIREPCSPLNPLCYDIINDISTFLNNPEIQMKLGVDRDFAGCNFLINFEFLGKGDVIIYIDFIKIFSG